VDIAERQIELVVRGRNVEVPEHFRQLVIDKLSRVERYDHKISRTDVELTHENNPRQTGSCQHIEVTCRTRGPVVRAEACAADFYKALDLVVDKLERRLRHAADRRRVHHGRRTPVSVAVATATTAEPLGGEEALAQTLVLPERDEADLDTRPGQIVREKEHTAKPMTVDQALFEMELVGHDFFLFADVDSGKPSVVYRRHAYDYGLIRLAG
jgi:ribosomal subunit interface protein